MEKFIKLNCFKSVMVVITSTPTVTIRLTPDGSSVVTSIGDGLEGLLNRLNPRGSNRALRRLADTITGLLPFEATIAKGSSGYALLIKHIGVNGHLQTDLNILEEEFLSRGPRFDGAFESNPGWLTNLLRTLSKQGFATITPTGRVFAEAIDHRPGGHSADDVIGPMHPDWTMDVAPRSTAAPVPGPRPKAVDVYADEVLSKYVLGARLYESTESGLELLREFTPPGFVGDTAQIVDTAIRGLGGEPIVTSKLPYKALAIIKEISQKEGLVRNAQSGIAVTTIDKESNMLLEVYATESPFWRDIVFKGQTLLNYVNNNFQKLVTPQVLEALDREETKLPEFFIGIEGLLRGIETIPARRKGHLKTAGAVGAAAVIVLPSMAFGIPFLLKKPTQDDGGEQNLYAPEIDLPNNLEFKVGEHFEYQINASDNDGDKLTYKLMDAPPGVQITKAGKLVGNLAVPGTYHVGLEVSDGKHKVPKGFDLIINEKTNGNGHVGENLAPILLDSGIQQVPGGFRVTANASSLQNDSNPESAFDLYLDGRAYKTFSGKQLDTIIGNLTLGQHELKLVARDTNDPNLRIEKVYTLNVEKPSENILPNAEINIVNRVGDSFDLQLNANSGLGDVDSLAQVSLFVDGEKISWTPNTQVFEQLYALDLKEKAGTVHLSLQALDSQASAQDNKTIEAIDDLPELRINFTPSNSTPENVWNWNAYVNDIDTKGNSTFRMQSVGLGIDQTLNVSLNSGTPHGFINASSATPGNYEVKFSVGATEQTANIFVKNDNASVVWQATPQSNPNKVDFSASGLDPDTEFSFSYTIQTPDGGETVSSGFSKQQTFAITRDYTTTTPGPASVTLTLTDSLDSSKVIGEKQFAIPDDPPVFGNINASFNPLEDRLTTSGLNAHDDDTVITKFDYALRNAAQQVVREGVVNVTPGKTVSAPGLDLNLSGLPDGLYRLALNGQEFAINVSHSFDIVLKDSANPDDAGTLAWKGNRAELSIGDNVLTDNWQNGWNLTQNRSLDLYNYIVSNISNCPDNVWEGAQWIQEAVRTLSAGMNASLDGQTKNNWTAKDFVSMFYYVRTHKIGDGKQDWSKAYATALTFKSSGVGPIFTRAVSFDENNNNQYDVPEQRLSSKDGDFIPTYTTLDGFKNSLVIITEPEEAKILWGEAVATDYALQSLNVLWGESVDLTRIVTDYATITRLVTELDKPFATSFETLQRIGKALGILGAQYQNKNIKLSYDSQQGYILRLI